MRIEQLAKVLGLCDATRESAEMAAARFALRGMFPGGLPVPFREERCVNLLADVLEAYTYMVQESGVRVNGDDECKEL